MKKLWIFLLILLLSGCKEAVTPPNEIDCEQTPTHESCENDDDNDDDDVEVDIQTIINNIMDPLTLRQKAAQMVQAERGSISPSDVMNYQVGSILSGGGSHPSNYNNSVDDWYQMVRNYQEAALNSDSGIPIMYGIDAVHGHNNVFGATIFPHNIGLGAANDADLVYRIAKATAEEMLVTGIPWTFAPALSIVQNTAWGRTYEGYSEDTDVFMNLTQSAILGLEENGVSATAKHYLADGATVNGIDQGDVWVSDELLRNAYLLPYIEAIEANVDTIMISYSSVRGIKMHEHDYWIRTVLKEELGFEGFVISDWNAIHQLSGSYNEQVAKSINAGVDMLMEPYTWKEAIDAIVYGVENNLIPMERIDDAVYRILKVKYERGLFEDPYVRLDASYLYNEEHQALAREAVRKSLVLLKNEESSLPLSKDETIYLTGEASDNVGYMAGGWTTYWQGNTAANIGVGTSIKDAFDEVLSTNGGSLTTSVEDASTVIVVLSEVPYSEGVGDNQSPTLTSHTADSGNTAALEIAREAHLAGKKVIGILISGRPMLLEDHLDYFDAFIAAWLPGSEGGHGISDVVFGDYDFTGKLSYTWPKTAAQLSYSILREDYDPTSVMFPYGYGLTYTD
ncbi:MAG: glycoside hydrolase family 3 protein [Candidatus Izemoplasmataceae bacterium]